MSEEESIAIRMSDNTSIDNTNSNYQAIRMSSSTNATNADRLGLEPINEDAQRLNLQTVRKGLGNETLTFSQEPDEFLENKNK